MLIAVVGATAAGKSDLAVDLALALGGEVINADSMQLYRGMDIGTAKLTIGRAPRRPAPPARRLGRHQDRQRRRVPGARGHVIDDIEARGKVPVLVGGSGLYIRAALGDLEFPGTDEEIASALEAELAARRPGRRSTSVCRPPTPPRRPRSCPQRPPDRPRARGDRAVRPPVQRDDARLRRVAARRSSSASSGPPRARPADRGARRPDVGGRASRRRYGRSPPSACATARPRAAPSATSRMLRALDGEWTARAGPRGDGPGDPPIRPPPGILVQERPARSPGSAPGADLTTRALTEIAFSTSLYSGDATARFCALLNEFLLVITQ